MIFLDLFSGNSGNKSSSGGVPSSNAGPQEREISAADREQRRQDHDDIVRFLSGDNQGFEDLMTRYRQRAYGIALGLTGNHDDAMDAMQKAFIRIHRSLPRFRLEEPFFPWLYRIVKNTALNQKRDEKRHRGDVPLEWVKQSDGQPDPLSVTVAEEFRRQVWDGIQELPPEMREIFVLYHFQGLKYREIATACDVPIGTVMSRLHAARTRLRQAAGLEEGQ